MTERAPPRYLVMFADNRHYVNRNRLGPPQIRCVGVVLAWATDQGGNGRSVVSQLRNAVGSLSSPWVLIPFVAGACATTARRGALLGLAATLSALAGWYLCATALEDL